jgi:hypothetical protein
MAKKKTVAKKVASKKVATKRVAVAKVSARVSKPDANLDLLLSKIQIELDNGKSQKLSKKDILMAKECLSKTGKILLSVRAIISDGTKNGTGTQLID